MNNTPFFRAKLYLMGIFDAITPYTHPNFHFKAT